MWLVIINQSWCQNPSMTLGGTSSIMLLLPLPWQFFESVYTQSVCEPLWFSFWRRKWQPTPVFLLGESPGSQRVGHDSFYSLGGLSPVNSPRCPYKLTSIKQSFIRGGLLSYFKGNGKQKIVLSYLFSLRQLALYC